MLLKGKVNLFFTLNNGQVFHWKQRSMNEFVGVINGHVMKLIGKDDGVMVEDITADNPWSNDMAMKVVYDYFQMNVNMDALYDEWSKDCKRIHELCKSLDGMRIIKQDPFECLISFILSSNNNIPRIKQMNEKLRKRYGSLIKVKNEIVPSSSSSNIAPQTLAETEEVFYSFPTVEQLVSGATEEELRGMGFGYRAKFVVGTAIKIKEEKIDLNALAELGAKDPCDKSIRLKVRETLMMFPGVGPKVADCCALFSMNQTMSIPVDTHVLQIAQRDYAAESIIKKYHKSINKPTPSSITPVVYEIIGDIFRDKYGKYSGWGHCFLFAAELAHLQQYIPKPIKIEPIITPILSNDASNDKKRTKNENENDKKSPQSKKQKRNR